MLEFLSYLIIIFGSFNLIRLGILMIGVDIHDIKSSRTSRQNKAGSPWISIIVPAYNEELGITRCLASLSANSYAHMEVIVVNDGSKDATAKRVASYQRKTRGSFNLRLINQKNSGKAAAINNGVSHAKGSLVMVLDADSILAPDAIAEVPRYFQDKKILLAAANVKIIDDGRILSTVQRYEYLISYRSKKALNTYNMEYIVGGVGSTFRKHIFKKVRGYDTDTMTEDIDFTLKVLQLGNRERIVSYMPTVRAYTEGVLNLSDLIKQRYRWKYGRMQSFLKNRNMFFNAQRKYDKRLTFLQLPYALWAEIIFSLEPILIAYFLVIIAIYGDLATLASAYSVTTGFILWNVVMDDSETRRSKFRLIPLALLQYPLFFILAMVEYVALAKSIGKIHKLKSSLKQGHGAWEHVTRAAESTITSLPKLQ